jgi:formylglycine-generating enzyme required for sulfatase activity
MVTISRGFWLGACDVTQRQWSQMMPSNPSDFHGACLPVDNVTWGDACEFCRQLTAQESAAGRLPAGYAYMLPTEAQWEYAASAGAPARTTTEVLEQAWCATNSGTGDTASGVWRMSTHPVGEKRPNAWGFYDLLGNVAEWCADWSDTYPAGDVTDPCGPDHGTYRVLRGGCWWADVQNCRPESRHKAPPGRHHSALGLRVGLRTISP